MVLKCVTCDLLFRNRNELKWHIRQEHLRPRLRRPTTSGAARGYARERDVNGGESTTAIRPKLWHKGSSIAIPRGQDMLVDSG